MNNYCFEFYKWNAVLSEGVSFIQNFNLLYFIFKTYQKKLNQITDILRHTKINSVGTYIL